MDAAAYRAKARELREKAATTDYQKARAVLLKMADQYDLLAAAAEDQQREPKNRSAKRKAPQRGRGEVARPGWASEPP
jgi:hypothetical protein